MGIGRLFDDFGFLSGLSSAFICINLGIASFSFTPAWYDMLDYLWCNGFAVRVQEVDRVCFRTCGRS